jgi:cell division septation protein DedD
VEVQPLKIIASSSGKALVIVFIAVVVVLALVAGASWYFQKNDSHRQLEPQLTVTRHKIPSAPVQPAQPVHPELPEEEVVVVQPDASDAPRASDPAPQATPDMDMQSAAPAVVETPQVDEVAPVVVETPQRGVAPLVIAMDEAEASDGVAGAADKPVDEQAVATPKAVDTQPLEEKSFFAIQVGAYRVKDNANSKVAELQKKGYEAFIIDTADAKAQILYTVCIGRYDSKTQAQAPLSEFKQKEKEPAFIMRADR